MSTLINEATIKVRRDSASNWTSNNPTLNQGEWGYETDTGKVKIGDGSTAWSSLAYFPLLSDVSAKLTGDTKQLCKAWVNFDGTTNVGGFCTIRDSYNVTSVTDNGTGDYTINFTNAMSDANYSVQVTIGVQAASYDFACGYKNGGTKTTDAVQVLSLYNHAVNNASYMSVAIFGS